jgi:hypothetical protein
MRLSHKGAFRRFSVRIVSLANSLAPGETWLPPRGPAERARSVNSTI